MEIAFHAKDIARTNALQFRTDYPYVGHEHVAGVDNCEHHIFTLRARLCQSLRSGNVLGGTAAVMQKGCSLGALVNLKLSKVLAALAGYLKLFASLGS